MKQHSNYRVETTVHSDQSTTKNCYLDTMPDIKEYLLYMGLPEYIVDEVINSLHYVGDRFEIKIVILGSDYSTLHPEPESS